MSIKCPKCENETDSNREFIYEDLKCSFCGFVIKNKGCDDINVYDGEGELITIDIPEGVIKKLKDEAHKKDITLNEYINRYIKSYIEEAKYAKKDNSSN